jgi:hypothetical protein
MHKITLIERAASQVMTLQAMLMKVLVVVCRYLSELSQRLAINMMLLSSTSLSLSATFSEQVSAQQYKYDPVRLEEKLAKVNYPTRYAIGHKVGFHSISLCLTTVHAILNLFNAAACATGKGGIGVSRCGSFLLALAVVRREDYHCKRRALIGILKYEHHEAKLPFLVVWVVTHPHDLDFLGDFMETYERRRVKYSARFANSWARRQARSLAWSKLKMRISLISGISWLWHLVHRHLHLQK